MKNTLLAWWRAARSGYGRASRRRRNRIRLQLAAAAAMLVLGLGNLLFGQYKYHEYRKLWREATRQPGLSAIDRRLPLLSPSVDVVRERQQILKLRSRLGFYEVVSLGGQCFLVVGGVVILWTAVALLKSNGSSTAETPDGP